MTDYQVETLLGVFRYHDRHGLWGNPQTLGWLLGHSPTTFAAFFKRVTRQELRAG